MPPEFKHKMLHPCKGYDDDEEMEVIEATVSLCAQYKGVPIGPALIQYQHPKYEHYSFKGVGVFNQHGQLHNTAFSCLRGDGYGELLTNMQEGRPAHHSHCSWFCRDGYTAYVTSKETKSDVSGWQYYSGQTDKQGRASGHGKEWHDYSGDVYISGYEKGNRT
jgi:hypothetical protein